MRKPLPSSWRKDQNDLPLRNKISEPENNMDAGTSAISALRNVTFIPPLNNSQSSGASAILSNLPSRNARVGSTRRFSAVEVTSPPRITIAIGPSISRPGSPLPIANGSSPRPVTNAAIKIGASLSEAPRSAVSNPQIMPSTLTKCSQCEISMMELRRVIPNRVTKPTSDPTKVGLQTGTASADYIQLWHGDANLLQESLEVVRAPLPSSSGAMPHKRLT